MEDICLVDGVCDCYDIYQTTTVPLQGEYLIGCCKMGREEIDEWPRTPACPGVNLSFVRWDGRLEKEIKLTSGFKSVSDLFLILSWLKHSSTLKRIFKLETGLNPSLKLGKPALCIFWPIFIFLLFEKVYLCRWQKFYVFSGRYLSPYSLCPI